jgi:hypothetical protein
VERLLAVVDPDLVDLRELIAPAGVSAGTIR